MKQGIKQFLIGFIIGGLIFGCVTVYAAVLIASNEVSYTPGDSNWNVDNTESALNDLYDTTLNKKNNIINSLNRKCLNLSQDASFDNIVSEIDTLPIGNMDDGNCGYVKEGTDDLLPFGGGGTVTKYSITATYRIEESGYKLVFNLKSIPNYDKLVYLKNFFILPITIRYFDQPESGTMTMSFNRNAKYNASKGELVMDYTVEQGTIINVYTVL